MIQKAKNARGSLLALVSIIALGSGVVIYHENTRCIDDHLTNCEVNKDNYEKIVNGLGESEVAEILGKKNIVHPSSHRPGTCRESDSALFWESHAYLSQSKKVEIIEVGFKAGKVNCKLYAQGRAVEEK